MENTQFIEAIKALNNGSKPANMQLIEDSIQDSVQGALAAPRGEEALNQFSEKLTSITSLTASLVTDIGWVADKETQKQILDMLLASVNEVVTSNVINGEIK